jgi:uncharacterized protein (DUF2236 family)
VASEPDDGPLFPVDSVTHRVSRESALVLAGGRALLMQLAHPGVAAGVAEHSDYTRHPLRRLTRTLDLTLGMIFADREGTMASAREVNRTHRRIRGEGYSAGDPALLLWVHATLIDTTLMSYPLFVGPLTEAERSAYYEEAKRLGGLLGLPADRYPEGIGGFDAYMREMLAGDELRIDDRARGLARDVLWPSIGVLPRRVWHPMAALTAGLLPATLREAYGLPWGRTERGLHAAAVRATRATVPHLPGRLRHLAASRARRAAQRAIASPSPARSAETSPR